MNTNEKIKNDKETSEHEVHSHGRIDPGPMTPAELKQYPRGRG